MIQLELVKNVYIDPLLLGDRGEKIRKTVVAVSTSYDALSHYAKTNGLSINESNSMRQTYYIIQESDIAIVPFNFKRQLEL